jgi:hypothetical protein
MTVREVSPLEESVIELPEGVPLLEKFPGE